MNETKVSELPDIAERLRMYESAEWGTALRDIRDAADEIDRLRKHRNMLEQEILTFRERVAFLESPEVCAAAHDDVSECGYCQRDRYYPGYIRYEYLRTLSVRAIAELWASSFMPSGLPLDDMVDRARKAALAARGKDE